MPQNQVTNSYSESPETNSPPTPVLKVGLVGTGYAAKKRAEALCNDERSQLAFVSGNMPEHTDAFCQTYSTEAKESWQELVTESSLDLVIISNINKDHGRIARAALEAGKHVVCEYPLALEAVEARDLVELAKTQGKLLHIEHIELLGGLHQAIRQALPQIGKVFYASYTTISPKHPAPHNWTYHRQMYGFPLVAALSRIHRFTDLFGTVAALSCQANFWDTLEPYYYSACLCDAQLRFASGLIAHITYGKGDVFWQARRTFELQGEAGTLIFAGERGKLVRGEEEIPIEVGSRRGLFAKDTTMVLDHLLDGKPLYVEPQASLYALKIANSAHLSAQTGQTINLL